jgi:hypothetical protein
MTEHNLVTPPSILKEAIKAVPAVKYALGIGGIIAVIAIISAFGISFRVALLGAVVMIILMTVLVVFASISPKKLRVFTFLPLSSLGFVWSL